MPAAKHLTEGELRAVVNDLIIDWHPDSQAAVVTLATAEQLPANIKKHAAETGTPRNTIRAFRHNRNCIES
jgi:hypothetical protein